MKQQTKSKIELSKLKKQSQNQAKANTIRLEKTVNLNFYNFSYRIPSKLSLKKNNKCYYRNIVKRKKFKKKSAKH